MASTPSFVSLPSVPSFASVSTSTVRRGIEAGPSLPSVPSFASVSTSTVRRGIEAGPSLPSVPSFAGISTSTTCRIDSDPSEGESTIMDRVMAEAEASRVLRERGTKRAREENEDGEDDEDDDDGKNSYHIGDVTDVPIADPTFIRYAKRPTTARGFMETPPFRVDLLPFRSIFPFHVIMCPQCLQISPLYSIYHRSCGVETLLFRSLASRDEFRERY
jgi:hypothetical protein